MFLSLSTSVLAFETDTDSNNSTQQSTNNNSMSNDTISEENSNENHETAEHNIILQNSSEISTRSNSVNITTFDDLKVK